MFAERMLERCGTTALLKFTAALLVLVVLHVARIPLVLLVRVVAGVVGRLDGYLSRQVTVPARGPVNRFVVPGPASVRVPQAGGVR